MPFDPNYRKTRETHKKGTRALQPIASDVLNGTLYFVTDENIIERSNGTIWEKYSSPAFTGGNISGIYFGFDSEEGIDSFIPGPPGSIGLTGIQGIQGIPGLDGLDGEDGFFYLLNSFQGLPGPLQTYTETNVTTDRTYDANATTLDEIADVLGTLIGDLRARGMVS